MAEERLNKEELKSSIKQLREKLNELDHKKEEWFKKKEELKAKIGQLISQIKEEKAESDSFSASISESKKKRDEFNSQVRELIARIKELNRKKDEILAKVKSKGGPSELKSRIERLEQSLETQAYSFDREKEIMKEINALKKQYETAKEAEPILKEIGEVAVQINDAKKKGNEFHSRLKETSSANRKRYDKFRKLSREIPKLKKAQEEAFSTFIRFKQEYSEAGRELKAKLKEMDSISAAEGAARKKSKREKKAEVARELKKKTQDIEEKFKKKKILTTEDLITLQGGIEDSENF